MRYIVIVNKEKFMKQYKWLCLIICCTGILFLFFQYEINTSSFVKKNYKELNEFVNKIKLDNSTKDQQKSFYKGWNVTYWKENGMVEFKKGVFGIGSSTTYKGFYYSPTDEPLGFQGTNIKFEKKGKGWKWKEKKGDNWEYTERIMSNWFKFEIHF